MIVWFFFLPRYMSINKDSSHPAVKYFSNDCFLQNEGFFFFSFAFLPSPWSSRHSRKSWKWMRSSQAMADVAEQAFNQSITNAVFLKLLFSKNINCWWCWSIQFSELKIASEIKLQNYKIWTEAYGNDMLLFVDIIPWCFWSSPCSGIFW